MHIDGAQLFVEDTSVTTVVPAIVSATSRNRVLKLLTFFNPDALTLLVTIQKRKGNQVFRVKTLSIAQNADSAYDDPVILTDADEDIQVFLDQDPTSPMEITSTWGDF